jgi:eukaryotic-like serine/threonine-protein kinase
MTTAPPQIPNYAIIEKLGEGGMASVWLAQRNEDSRLSVIKVLHAHLANDTVVQSRFIREAQVASFLDHPNISRLYDAGRSGASSYIAMEFIAGMEVETMMMKLAKEKQAVPPDLSLTLTLRVLEALHYAHEFKTSEGEHLEIVHRDLSPRNVMLGFDGTPKIIDFGLVRTNLGDFRTAPGMIAGTLRYMSPEQATAERIDRRSDLYTWSVVLYELLTGRPLITATEARAILGAVVVDVPPPVSEKNPQLPKKLDAVLAKALEKDPEKRFASAHDLRDALALAAGPLGTTKPEQMGEFVSTLFPAEKTKADERMSTRRAISTEGVAFESTRVAESPAQHEKTVSDRRRPLPLPIPKRSSTPRALVGVAAIVGAAALIATLRPSDDPEPAPAPPPPPAVGVIVRSAPPPPAVDQPPPPAPVRKAPRIEPPKNEPPPVTPPPPKFAASPTELADEFIRDATDRLGKDRAKQLYASCGLAQALALQDEAMIRRLDRECRAALAREKK